MDRGLRATNHILNIKGLCVEFPHCTGWIRILDRLDFCLKYGEIHGIVGPSGCGKSVFARSVMRLEAPGRISAGSIKFKERELTCLGQRDMAGIRGKRLSLALQDPLAAMDPVFTIASQFRDILRVAMAYPQGGSCKTGVHTMSTVFNLLRRAGISSPEKRCCQYPHEWSRGMLQRAQIVMAFLLSPDVVILDEVTSALDPTMVLRILDLIVGLKEEYDTAIILITHDLCAAVEVCNRLSIMYRGTVVETGTTARILEDACHPYTRLLVSTVFDTPFR